MPTSRRKPSAKLPEATVQKVQRKSDARPSGPGDSTTPVAPQPPNRRGAMRGEAGAKLRAKKHPSRSRSTAR